MAHFLVQTIPKKLPEFLMNLSSQGPHLMGATLSTLLRALRARLAWLFDYAKTSRRLYEHPHNPQAPSEVDMPAQNDELLCSSQVPVPGMCNHEDWPPEEGTRRTRAKKNHTLLL